MISIFQSEFDEAQFVETCTILRAIDKDSNAEMYILNSGVTILCDD